MNNPPTDSRPHSTTAPTLSGAWLWLGRGFWLAMFLVCITMLVNSLSLIRPVVEHVRQTHAPGIFTALGSVPLVRRYLLVFVFYGVGAFLFWQRSEDRTALLMACTLLGVGSLPLASGVFSLTEGVMEIPVFLTQLGMLLYSLTIFISILTLYLFPDGRFVPRQSAWVLAPAVTGAALYGIAFSRTRQVPLPLFAGLIAMVLVGVYFQTVRYRKFATPIQRQQIKWFSLGVVAFVVFQTIGIFAGMRFSGQTTASGYFYSFLAEMAFFAAYFVPLVTILTAVIRFRLFDINYVINRSIVYAGVTLSLALVFSGAFFGVQAAGEALLGGERSELSAGVAGVLVALLFQPTRVRVRRWVDRRLYGIEVDYTEAARQQAQRARLVMQPASTDFGDYGRLELLGRGGMGEVYRATHPTLGHPVAIKLLRGSGEDNPAARKRFLREARAVARLQHPNIVALHEVSELDDRLYMVMEYVDGDTLSARLGFHGVMALEQARPILRDVAAALDYAHAAGIVHRDIKPSNVIVETGTAADGKGGQRAVLMDFGIAKISDLSQMTQTGMMGTLDYIAPEQIQGASGVDRRADVYSLGVMTYQMLVGETPFKHGSAGALILAHLMQPPPDARDKQPGLPKAAAAAIQQAMSKKPEDRFASAGEFVKALG